MSAYTCARIILVDASKDMLIQLISLVSSRPRPPAPATGLILATTAVIGLFVTAGQRLAVVEDP